MKKIIVIGCPGSGKTTFAKKLCEKTGIELVHLDAIWHRADRTHISRDEFDARLTEILSRDSYIIDGNYSRTVERRIAACDTVFLFDLPTDVCLDGAIARVGTKRPDMPWIDTELDPKLRDEIESFRCEKLPEIYALLEKYSESKAVTVFKSRKEADIFLDKLTKMSFRTSRVTVVPYDAAWKSEFEKIKREVESSLGTLAVGIEHVGSTSVEGLCAKPCIDIDVVIKDYTVFDAVVERLSSIGYTHEGDLGIRGREAFGYTDKAHLYKHHLYVCPQDSAELFRHVTFRDFLRNNPAYARKYGEVKTEAAELYPDDIDAYIAHKSPCIKEIYALCGLE